MAGGLCVVGALLAAEASRACSLGVAESVRSMMMFLVWSKVDRVICRGCSFVLVAV